MGKDYPDFASQKGRAVGGETIDSYSFSQLIAAGATANIDVPIVATDEEHFYQSLVIAVPNDTAIHRVILSRIVGAYAWWMQDFVTGGNWDVPGFTFSEGQQMRISITNNSAGALTFIGAIFRVIRSII